LLAQVRVMSAEGRMSAWILCLLPLGTLLLMMVTNPVYVRALDGSHRHTPDLVCAGHGGCRRAVDAQADTHSGLGGAMQTGQIVFLLIVFLVVAGIALLALLLFSSAALRARLGLLAAQTPSPQNPQAWVERGGRWRSRCHVCRCRKMAGNVRRCAPAS
jgi:Flp pilus assembly protein TadB